MKTIALQMALGVLALVSTVRVGRAESPDRTEAAASAAESPAAKVAKKAAAEVDAHYAKAHPEIKEYVLWTAKNFGPGGMWLPDDAFADLPADAREKRIEHLATLLSEAEYGRHLCAGLAEASAIPDKRLVPGLMKVAGYHQADRDYDCRAKWMAVAALARQQSDDAVPLLVSLVDHGNQNTRNWSRAALSRIAKQDFKQDKHAWAKWWQEQGHDPIDAKLLEPSAAQLQSKK